MTDLALVALLVLLELPVPPAIHRKLGAAGIFAAANGPKLIPPEFADKLPPGIPVAEAILAHGSKDHAKVVEIMMPTRWAFS